MPDRYFDKFPLINYSNNSVVNIMERAVLLNSVVKNPYIYYPLDINNEIRPDTIAGKVYNDPYKTWVLYMTNNIIDPYYQWYLNPDDFNEFLKIKYSIGVVDILKQKTAYYRNNWYTGSDISVSAFNALANTEHIYWEPVYGTTDIPQSYARKQVDWTINTNQIVTYTVSTTKSFITNEILKVVFADHSVGNGQVVIANSSQVTIQHTTGYTVNSASGAYIGYIYGTESHSNVTFSNTMLVSSNIPLDEQVYWSPVSIYDMEAEKNEYNKSIKVLDSRYQPQLSNELKKLLAQ